MEYTLVQKIGIGALGFIIFVTFLILVSCVKDLFADYGIYKKKSKSSKYNVQTRGNKETRASEFLYQQDNLEMTRYSKQHSCQVADLETDNSVVISEPELRDDNERQFSSDNNSVSSFISEQGLKSQVMVRCETDGTIRNEIMAGNMEDVTLKVRGDERMANHMNNPESYDWHSTNDQLNSSLGDGTIPMKEERFDYFKSTQDRMRPTIRQQNGSLSSCSEDQADSLSSARSTFVRTQPMFAIAHGRQMLAPESPKMSTITAGYNVQNATHVDRPRQYLTLQKQAMCRPDPASSPYLNRHTLEATSPVECPCGRCSITSRCSSSNRCSTANRCSTTNRCSVRNNNSENKFIDAVVRSKPVRSSRKYVRSMVEQFESSGAGNHVGDMNSPLSADSGCSMQSSHHFQDQPIEAVQHAPNTAQYSAAITHGYSKCNSLFDRLQSSEFYPPVSPLNSLNREFDYRTNTSGSGESCRYLGTVSSHHHQRFPSDHERVLVNDGDHLQEMETSSPTAVDHLFEDNYNVGDLSYGRELPIEKRDEFGRTVYCGSLRIEGNRREVTSPFTGRSLTPDMSSRFKHNTVCERNVSHATRSLDTAV